MFGMSDDTSMLPIGATLPRANRALTDSRASNRGHPSGAVCVRPGDAPLAKSDLDHGVARNVHEFWRYAARLHPGPATALQVHSCGRSLSHNVLLINSPHGWQRLVHSEKHDDA